MSVLDPGALGAGPTSTPRSTVTANKASLSFMIILSSLMACTSLSTDLYLPALPAMEADLHGDSELTVTGFVVGFALAQLVWGPISDRIGRKKPLIIGMALFAVGSVGCALSSSIAEIVLWWMFQAIGACVGPMLSRSMIRDLYGSTQAARMLSTLMVIMAVAPIAGPLAGGGLLKLASWHMIFWLMAAIGAILFLAVLSLPESLPAEKRAASASLRAAFTSYLILRYTLCVTCFYVAVYAFITGSSFVYITYFHVNPELYGFLFGVNIVGVAAMSAVNRELVKRYSLPGLLRVATVVAAVGAVCLVICAFTGFGGIWGVIIPVFIMFSMNGVIAATTNAAALGSIDSAMAGSGAALLGSLQYGSGVVASLLLAVFSSGTPCTMAWVMGLFVVLSAVLAVGRRSASSKAVVATVLGESSGPEQPSSSS